MPRCGAPRAGVAASTMRARGGAAANDDGNAQKQQRQQRTYLVGVRMGMTTFAPRSRAISRPVGTIACMAVVAEMLTLPIVMRTCAAQRGGARCINTGTAASAVATSASRAGGRSYTPLLTVHPDGW